MPEVQIIHPADPNLGDNCTRPGFHYLSDDVAAHVARQLDLQGGYDDIFLIDSDMTAMSIADARGEFYCYGRKVTLEPLNETQDRNLHIVRFVS